jgi:hypothetical protein
MRRATIIAAMLLALLALNLPPTPAPAAEDDRWALIVGVDRFQGRTRPNVGSVGDAHAFHDLLLRHGWRGDRIRVLTDGAATAEAIRAGVRWLVDSSTPNSQSVFHYSGHVKQIAGDQDRDGEALDEYLWPHDNRFIADGELAQNLRQLKGLAWIDISGCEAGGFNEQGLASPRRIFTASSAEPEKSYEHPEWQNSVWNGLLVEQGMLKGAADSNGDGDVTLREAVEWAAPRAASMTKNEPKGPQNPFAAGGDETNWFARPAPPPSKAPDAPPEKCLAKLPGGLCLRPPTGIQQSR